MEPNETFDATDEQSADYQNLTARSQDAGFQEPISLADPTPCFGNASCQIQRGEWSGMPFFKCGACKFETFDESVAQQRADLSSVSLD
jgi:hypothetical protein